MSHKIFVTGSEGFIGSHLVETLAKRNEKVKAFVQYNSFGNIGWLKNVDKKCLKNIEIIFGDLRDINILSESLKNCNTVVHLASLISIPYSYKSSRSYFQTNVLGLINLIESSQKHMISKFIHTSTSEVYGTSQAKKISEKHRLFAQSPYAASKISADKVVESYVNSFSFPAITLRPFNTFGPRQSNRAVIPTIITQILSGEQKIYLGNTKTKRDFNYIDDTINAFLLAIKSKKFIGKTYNIGSGNNYSIKEIVEIISSILRTKIRVVEDKKRIRPKKSEVMNLLCDNELIKKDLKWKPIYSNKEQFRNSLIKTIEWFKNKDNLKYYNSKIYSI